MKKTLFTFALVVLLGGGCVGVLSSQQAHAASVHFSSSCSTPYTCAMEIRVANEANVNNAAAQIRWQEYLFELNNATYSQADQIAQGNQWSCDQIYGVAYYIATDNTDTWLQIAGDAGC